MYVVWGSGISGFAAHRRRLPCTTIGDKAISSPDIGLVSFPGGNAAFLRIMLERMIPGTIQTQETGSLAAARGRIDPGRLDRRGNKIRIRSASTAIDVRSEEHTSELPSLMRLPYAVFCLK